MGVGGGGAVGGGGVVRGWGGCEGGGGVVRGGVWVGVGGGGGSCPAEALRQRGDWGQQPLGTGEGIRGGRGTPPHQLTGCRGSRVEAERSEHHRADQRDEEHKDTATLSERTKFTY